MRILSQALIALIALEHAWFLVLEMFLFKTPYGQKTFAITAEFAREAAPLAANQGLYNGFLAAGLAWGLATANPSFIYFFLGCVVVAGLFGGFTVSRAIWFAQALPAVIALALFGLANR
jgi:putative membrane protein